MANFLQKALVNAGNTLVKAGGAAPTIVRSPISNSDLDILVREKFEQFLDDGSPFTAFEITTSIRNENPDKDIPHKGAVRELVHQLADEQGLQMSFSEARGGATLFYPLPEFEEEEEDNFDSEDVEDDEFDEDLEDEDFEEEED